MADPLHDAHDAHDVGMSSLFSVVPNLLVAGGHPQHQQHLSFGGGLSISRSRNLNASSTTTFNLTSATFTAAQIGILRQARLEQINKQSGSTMQSGSVGSSHAHSSFSTLGMRSMPEGTPMRLGAPGIDIDHNASLGTNMLFDLHRSPGGDVPVGHKTVTLSAEDYTLVMASSLPSSQSTLFDFEAQRGKHAPLDGSVASAASSSPTLRLFVAEDKSTTNDNHLSTTSATLRPSPHASLCSRSGDQPLVHEGEGSSLVGSGASGSVSRMACNATGLLVAAKSIRAEQQKAITRELFVFSERRRLAIEAMSAGKSLTDAPPLGDEHLVTVHGAFPLKEGGVAIVMDLMHGSLQLQPAMPALVAASVAKDFLSGLRFMHDTLHVLHRDLKRSNLLYDAQGVVKICDFGLSCKLHLSSDLLTNEFEGSMLYMSPERLRGEAYGFPSDVFAFGVTMAHLALGEHPLTAALGSAMTGPSEGRFWGLCGAMCINDGPKASAAATVAAFSEALTKKELSDGFRRMILKCVAASADARPTCAELLECDEFVLTGGATDGATKEAVLGWLDPMLVD
jgi:hypothetical protein